MTTPPDRTLIELQAEALFTHDTRGRIVRINEPDGGPAPRFFLGRTVEGNTWRIRHDLPDDVARDLESLAISEPVSSGLESPPVCLNAIAAVLDRDQTTSISHAGPAFRFPDDLPAPPPGVTRLTFSNRDLLRAMPDWASDFQTEEQFDAQGPCLVAVEDGFAVSICACARLTAHAAEAGLETLGRYRGRGHATSVVVAWAQAIRDTGRIPLYSTSWDNHASRAIARKLGFIMYGSDLSLP